jgi:transposase
MRTYVRIMDRDHLATELAAGRSIESIARDVGRHPSTVAYWVKRHGLTSAHAARHAARGGLGREELEPLVAAGFTIREMAAAVDRSYATVRHWLREYGLRTAATTPPAAKRELEDGDVERECPRHGLTRHRRRERGFRCRRCRSEAVAERRRRVKASLVADAGGACLLCGYDRCPGALQFHHVDPATKRFHVALRGAARSLERMREEAQKCVLLCANCHAEVEAGVAELPLDSAHGFRPADHDGPYSGVAQLADAPDC